MSKYARITTGKFKGWQGWASSSGQGYFDVGIIQRKTRKGIVKGSDVGLGQVIDVPKKHLKFYR